MPKRKSRALALDDLPDLFTLHERHYGFYQPFCEMAADAASVSLARHHKGTNCLVDISRGDKVRTRRKLNWRPPSARAKASLANPDDATRDGAYAIAAATVEVELGLFVISRMDVRTGADYFIGEPGQDLEEAHRLEVSGTHLPSHDVRSRLARKVRQLLHGDSDLPAYACVAGFKVKEIALSGVVTKEQKKT